MKESIEIEDSSVAHKSTTVEEEDYNSVVHNSAIDEDFVGAHDGVYDGIYASYGFYGVML